MPMLNMLERGQQANKREGTAEAGKGEAAKSGFFLRLVVLLFFHLWLYVYHKGHGLDFHQICRN